MKTEIPDGTTGLLCFGSREIAYSLRVEKREKLRIVVSPDLSVEVTAPEGRSLGEIQKAIARKGRWLSKQLNELEDFHPLPSARHFVSGETFLYLGRQYRLKIKHAESPSAKLIGRHLEISTPDSQDKETIAGQVDGWYRIHAEVVFQKSFGRLEGIARRHGGNEYSFTIRKMQRRWGSCSAKKRITLNLFLVQAPVQCIDYVVMHELCHTIEHNHSLRFYRLLSLCMNDWKQRKQTLRRFSVPAHL